MKRTNIALLIVFLVFSTANIMAQGKIKFDKTTHDFGKVTEESKKAIVKFTFTNIGKGDLKLVNVRTSCGCTASEYTKGIIKPGEKGYVQATYFTTNRPGPFRKSITVTTNDVDAPNTVLFIKGKVTPKIKSEGDLFPITIGNLKLMSNHLAFNDIKDNEVKVDSVKIYNKWGHPMNIKFEQVPKNVTISVSSKSLESGKTAYIIVKYDAKLRGDYGLLFDRIAIRTNDNVQPVKILNVSANIKQDFTTLTPRQLKKAPKVKFADMDYDFGTEKSGTIVKHSFTFKNEGKSDLIIHKVKTSCGCTATKLASKVIKKGATSSIDIEFNTHGRKNLQHKTITVITNDPNNPEIVLNVHGKLK